MGTPQFAGLGVTTMMIVGIDLPIDWLCPLAILCGALATYGFTFLMRTSR